MRNFSNGDCVCASVFIDRALRTLCKYISFYQRKKSDLFCSLVETLSYCVLVVRRTELFKYKYVGIS